MHQTRNDVDILQRLVKKTKSSVTYSNGVLLCDFGQCGYKL